MAFGIASGFLVGLACGGATAVCAAFVRLKTIRGSAASLEIEAEAHQDALWRASEREERARQEGEAALVDALARADAGARAKARFLATVTHEMRTPLSGVIGTTDLLLDTALAPEQRTYARAVRQSAEAMLSLVDEILDMSRIEAGGLTPQDAPYPLAELVEGVAELLAPRAQAKGLELSVSAGPGAPEVAIGDVGRIRQILLNLAGNAVKFTTRGGIGLRVDGDGAEIRFTVADTGPGFEASEAERLFGEFEQGGAEIASGGVGLGLAISRRLAQAMGGALTADAELGVGAAFTLSLPVRPAPFAGPSPDPAPLAGRRVLIVTSAPFGGPWMAERLMRWGADAAVASPAGDIAAMAEGFDTVLLDRSDAGHGSTSAIAARRGGAARVLLMLSPAERRELPTLAADGFDGYLVKPVRAASLLSRLLDPRADGAAPAPEPHAAVAFPAAGGLRTLLAEDDPVSALIALAHLARLGCSAVHVADGLSACIAFEREPFDMVLLDLRMPSLDGCGAARRMRAFEARAGRTPARLVAVTANVAADDRKRAVEAGVDAVLPKPLDREALAALLPTRRDDRSNVA